jgi:hypothetical protein
MPSLHSAISPCCVNVGSGFLLTLAYSGIIIVRPGMTRLPSLRSGCHCVATARRITWTPPLWDPGKVLSKSGFSLTCTLPQWTNKYLLPPQIDDKRREPEMMPRLQALVNRVAKLHQASLRACHCAQEFTLWWIRPLGCQEKLAL